MHIPTVAILFDLFLTVFPGPALREATILPAPKTCVPCGPVWTWLGYYTPPTLSSQSVNPKIESKLKNPAIRRFPPFRLVVDNPSEQAASGNIVVIVAGNPRERETWSESARAHFGQTAFIFNNLFSVGDLAKTLSKFPEESVDYLIFGGHGEFSDGGVFMGIKNPSGRLFDPTRYAVFGEHINVDNLMSAANKPHRATIVRSLSKSAQVEFHVCVVGQERNLLNFAEALQRRCWANPGDVGEWGVGQYPWFYKDPPKRR